MMETIVARRHEIRVTLLFGNLLLFIAVILFGSLTPVPQPLAQQLYNSLLSIPVTPGSIFLHNAMISLIEFIPLLGSMFFFISGFVSGLSVSAISVAQGGSSLNYLWLLLNNYPHTWLEFFAYALAASEGTMLFLMLIAAYSKPLFRRELKIFGLTILVCGGLLVVGSLFETAAIAAIASKNLLVVVITWIIFGVGLVAIVYYDAKRRGLKLPHPVIPLALVEVGTIVGFALPTLLVFATLLWVVHVRYKGEKRTETSLEPTNSSTT
jgi:hypothetical protein